MLTPAVWMRFGVIVGAETIRGKEIEAVELVAQPDTTTESSQSCAHPHQWLPLRPTLPAVLMGEPRLLGPWVSQTGKRQLSSSCCVLICWSYPHHLAHEVIFCRVNWKEFISILNYVFAPLFSLLQTFRWLSPSLKIGAQSLNKTQGPHNPMPTNSTLASLEFNLLMPCPCLVTSQFNDLSWEELPRTSLG